MGKRYTLASAAKAGLTDGREQRFEPRTTPVSHQQRYTVPSGTRVAVTRIECIRWVSHVTTKECGFAKVERIVRYASGNLYEFRADGGWLMRVESHLVMMSEADRLLETKPQLGRKPRGPRKLRSPERIAKAAKGKVYT